jgi:hypothetical protein
MTIGFTIFCSSITAIRFFKSLFTSSKNRKEIKLQQGTPEEQKNLWNRKYSASEIIRINNWTNQGEASRNSAPEFQWTPRVPDTEVQFHFYMCVWHYGSSQAGHTGSSFYVPEVHYICTWHSGCLICTFGVPCCSSVSTLFLFLEKKL